MKEVIPLPNMIKRVTADLTLCILVILYTHTWYKYTGGPALCQGDFLAAYDIARDRFYLHPFGRKGLEARLEVLVAPLDFQRDLPDRLCDLGAADIWD